MNGTRTNGVVTETLSRIAGDEPSTPVPSDTAPRLGGLLRFGVWLAVLAPTVLMVVHFANAFGPARQVDWFDANIEGTLIAWSSGVATAGVAIGALLGAVMTGPRGPLLTLAAVTAFFSMDDVIAFHERLAAFLARRLRWAVEFDSVIWPVVYFPAMVIVAVLSLRVGRSGIARTFQLVVAGLTLLAAAVVLEFASSPWSEGVNIVHTIEGGVEEAFELAGWILMATGVLGAVVTNIARQAGRPPVAVPSDPPRRAAGA